MEDYVRARELAGSESLTAMAGEYGRLFRKVVQRVMVGQVVGELVAANRVGNIASPEPSTNDPQAHESGRSLRHWDGVTHDDEMVAARV